MRFIIIGIVLVFAGFLVLGIFGHNYQAATFESNEFGTCYEYSEDSPPVEINCSFKIFDQTVFFGIVLGFIGAGIIALIKGVKDVEVILTFEPPWEKDMMSEEAQLELGFL